MISTVGANLKEFADSLVAFIFSVFIEIIKKRSCCNTRMSCQLAVTEFTPEGRIQGILVLYKSVLL